MVTRLTSGTGKAGAAQRSKTGLSHHAADVVAVTGTKLDAVVDCDAASSTPGRPPLAEGDIAALARRHTAAALEAFVSVMQDNAAPPAARVAAATQILTWGHGKAVAGAGDDAPRTVRLAWEP